MKIAGGELTATSLACWTLRAIESSTGSRDVSEGYGLDLEGNLHEVGEPARTACALRCRVFRPFSYHKSSNAAYGAVSDARGA
jgi:hypothetical protein